MINFNFHNPTQIIFGKNTHHQVGEELKLYGNKVLFHYGGGSIKKSGLYDDVLQSLQREGIEIVELGGVEPNPCLDLVRKGIQICKDQQVNCILAVGGGSVIDSAKAIAAGVMYDGDVWDLFDGGGNITKALPIGVVLTIPAAGSESSSRCVVTNEEGYKRSTGGPGVRPQFAILNPELTYTLSPYQTACGIVDMFAHIVERYFTKVEAVEVTDRMSEGVMKAIINNAPKVLQNPNDYDARAELMLAGSIAHNDSLSVGKIGDWASHGIGHELSGIYNIAHGASLSIVLPAWMAYVYKQDIPRFVQYANCVWNVDINPFDMEQTALEGIQRTKVFFQSTGLPTSLQEANISNDRIQEMAKRALWKGTLGKFVSLSEKDVEAILQLSNH